MFDLFRNFEQPVDFTSVAWLPATNKSPDAKLMLFNWLSLFVNLK